MKIIALAWLLVTPLAWADAPCRVADSTPRFDSWLHERPDTVDARWQRDGCRIVVTQPGVPGMSAFRLTRDLRGRWQLMDETALPQPGRYQRFEPRRR
ncbi:hypothetical protein FVQ98_09570 [Ottowia sp. GY511]|uniref:Uncharacterized protein n=1 Tax=Ottowia flava TaxID=2675430 RepID=A0ABW4KWY3_9BURK|nr:hypothetical protein [Ottowia sp. GY511]TXK28544.1 hypothetical protein FVQ98_09570 [Ottowia sp. GY511]